MTKTKSAASLVLLSALAAAGARAQPAPDAPAYAPGDFAGKNIVFSDSTLGMGPAGAVFGSSELGITATGFTVFGAAPLAAQLSIVASVPAAAGVIEFAQVVGEISEVLNAGTNSLTIYAAAGGTIAGGASVALPPGAEAIVVQQTTAAQAVFVVAGTGGGSLTLAGVVAVLDTGTLTTGDLVCFSASSGLQADCGLAASSVLTSALELPAGYILGNPTGGVAAITANNLSAYMIAAFGDAQGAMVQSNGAGWFALAPGAAGQELVSPGSGANAWATIERSWGITFPASAPFAPGTYIVAGTLPTLAAIDGMTVIPRASAGATAVLAIVQGGTTVAGCGTIAVGSIDVFATCTPGTTAGPGTEIDIVDVSNSGTIWGLAQVNWHLVTP
jgi:hypothetical protein